MSEHMQLRPSGAMRVPLEATTVSGRVVAWTTIARMWAAAARMASEARSVCVPIRHVLGQGANNECVLVVAPSSASLVWRVEYWPARAEPVPRDLAVAAVDLARRWLSASLEALPMAESHGRPEQPRPRKRGPGRAAKAPKPAPKRKARRRRG